MHGVIIEKIGARIQGLRQQHGMTQDELAASSGVPQGNISRLERGLASDVQLTTLMKLARALGVSVEDLIAPIRGLEIEDDPEARARRRRGPRRLDAATA
jgi:transcriptional regulator with XRE-family HTH domain